MADVVLVAEDEAIVQRLMTRVLEGAGFAVVSVGSGDAALEALMENPGRFVAVVLDAGIAPKGAEPVLRHLLEMGGGPGVVLSSGADIDPELRDLLEEVGGDFVPKPFPPDTLLTAVRASVHP
jgi:DNA-binding response OmpR family regulator